MYTKHSEPMPRRARVRIANVPLHVVQRGNNKLPCFFSDGDRTYFLKQLAELSERFECAVHAYVLMTNHVHLLVTPNRHDGVSLLMKHLGQRYVQRVNRMHARTGSLWEGRYRSGFVDNGNYLFSCYRYIELNPVRAGIVNHPREYPWSSYRANAEGARSSVVRLHAEFMALGNTEHERQAAYRDLFGIELRPAQIDELRDLTNKGFAIGGAGFRQCIEAATGRRVSPAPRGPRPGHRLEGPPDQAGGYLEDNS